MNSSPPLLNVRDLTLSRGGRRLFSGLSFSLGPGELVQIMGPNGAGKSSLLLALAGILRADSGTVAGHAPRHLLTLLPAMKPQLTLLENLGFWRALHGGSRVLPDAALERVGLTGLGEIAAAHLSAGQMRRLTLARLLVSARALWLLDEPLATLDKSGTALVAELIDDHRRTGGGAVVASHDFLAGASETIALGGGTR